MPYYDLVWQLSRAVPQSPANRGTAHFGALITKKNASFSSLSHSYNSLLQLHLSLSLSQFLPPSPTSAAELSPLAWWLTDSFLGGLTPPKLATLGKVNPCEVPEVHRFDVSPSHTTSATQWAQSQSKEGNSLFLVTDRTLEDQNNQMFGTGVRHFFEGDGAFHSVGGRKDLDRESQPAEPHLSRKSRYLSYSHIRWEETLYIFSFTQNTDTDFISS